MANTLLVGKNREKMGKQISRQYRKGASIREIAETHNLSYGLVRTLLLETATQLRGRGRQVGAS